MRTDQLLSAALAGDQRSLAQLATLLERGGSPAVELHALLPVPQNPSHVVGLTGPPGSGKSSLLAALATRVSDAGRSIAVIAVDPTSPLSGGATLGDRIRMSQASLLPGVFVRSVAARHHVDGLAAVIPGMTRLFAAAGFDFVVIETVGAGQNQFSIIDYAHTLVLVEAPGAGDSVQMLKAGIMELADIYVVTKGDLPGAHRVSRDLKGTMGLAGRGNDWTPPVIVTSAETGEGVEELIRNLDRHMDWLKDSGQLAVKEAAMVRGAVRAALSSMIDPLIGEPAFEDLARDLIEHRLTPAEAAAIILRRAAELTAPG
ncbi:MAG: methylmalonyl Co-A mutase-associated GTPase MeaB [Thermomicrobiales bacterium]